MIRCLSMLQARNIILQVSGQRTYKEVKLDGIEFDKFYRNPLTKVFQYEYALYEAVSDLFAAMKCRSMCVDSLKLYFRELPHTPEQNSELGEEVTEEEKKEKDPGRSSFQDDTNGGKRCYREYYISNDAYMPG